MDTGGSKTLGRADAARNFLILHNDFPFPQRKTSLFQALGLFQTQHQVHALDSGTGGAFAQIIKQ